MTASRAERAWRGQGPAETKNEALSQRTLTAAQASTAAQLQVFQELFKKSGTSNLKISGASCVVHAEAIFLMHSVFWWCSIRFGCTPIRRSSHDPPDCDTTLSFPLHHDLTTPRLMVSCDLNYQHRRLRLTNRSHLLKLSNLGRLLRSYLFDPSLVLEGSRFQQVFANPILDFQQPLVS